MIQFFFVANYTPEQPGFEGTAIDMTNSHSRQRQRLAWCNFHRVLYSGQAVVVANVGRYPQQPSGIYANALMACQAIQHQCVRFLLPAFQNIFRTVSTDIEESV